MALQVTHCLTPRLWNVTKMQEALLAGQALDALSALGPGTPEGLGP